MTHQEKEMLDMHLKELTKHEVGYLQMRNAHRNEQGTYIYRSQDENDSIRLDLYLLHYKQYLIDNGIVKEVN